MDAAPGCCSTPSPCMAAHWAPLHPTDVPPCLGEECAGMNCSWTGWGPWSSCSRSCGVGQQQRLRAYHPPGPGGHWCEGILSAHAERRFCNLQACRGRGAHSKPGSAPCQARFWISSWSCLELGLGGDGSSSPQWTGPGPSGARGRGVTAPAAGVAPCAAAPAPTPHPRTAGAAAPGRSTMSVSATHGLAVGRAGVMGRSVGPHL